jgi:hypothetical protein
VELGSVVRLAEPDLAVTRQASQTANARKKLVMSMYNQPRPDVIQPTTVASALPKGSVKNTPARTNTAEIATVM